MRPYCTTFAMVALAAVLAAPAAWLPMACAAGGETRLEVRTDSSGAVPEVRIWINGKEVRPGDLLTLGDGKGRVEIRIETGRGGKDREESVRAPDRSDDGPPLLGVMVAPLDDDARKEAKAETGALVTDVMPDTPARRAGLRAGDVITGVDGRTVTSPQELVDRIRGRHPGDKVRLTWIRKGERFEEDIILGRQAEPDRPGQADEGFLGVSLGPLTPEVKEMAGTDRGVLVSSLTDDSPAAKAGIQPGDVITSIDGKEVNDPAEVVDIVRSRRPGQSVSVVYYRMGKRRQTEVTLGSRPTDARRRQDEPFFDFPGKWLQGLPELREYLNRLRPEIEEWAKRWQKEWGRPGPGFRSPRDRAEPETPRPQLEQRDFDRLMERLDRIEKRLSDIESRLDRQWR